MDSPKIGEVREFREHVRVPLVEKGIALDEPIPLDKFWDMQPLGFQYATVQRRWDGQKWVRVSDAPNHP